MGAYLPLPRSLKEKPLKLLPMLVGVVDPETGVLGTSSAREEASREIAGVVAGVA